MLPIRDDEEELIVDDLDLEGEDEDPIESGDEDLEEEPDEDEDELENEDEDDEEEDEPKTSRAQDRIRKLAKARKDAEAEKLRLQQELDSLRAQNNQPRQQQNDPQAVQAWLNSLPPEQRQIAQLQIQMQNHTQQMQIAQFNMQDSSDRNAFDAKAATNPLYRKYAAQVEQKLQELRKNQNLNAPREEILKHLIGERVLKIKGKPVTKGKAGKSVDKHTVKPANKKSDIVTGSRKGKTPKERLEGVRF